MKRSNKTKAQTLALVLLAAVALTAITLAEAGPLAGEILLRLVLIACGAVLLAKAGGTPSWIGAAFAVLGAWSLLGPAGGSILLLLAACLLYRGARKAKRLYSWSQVLQVSPVSKIFRKAGDRTERG